MNKVQTCLLYLIIATVSSCSNSANGSQTRERGTWDESTNTFIDKSRNLQWQLSNVDNWRIAEDYCLPDNAQFCAAADQYGICVMLTIIPIENEEESTSIWNASDSFINGMVSSFIKQAPIFSGIEYATPHVEKVKYLFKDALKITLYTQITDTRLHTDDAIPFAFQFYSFIKDDEVVVVCAMIPQYFLDKYGNEPFDDLLNRFSYIDATKEVH